MSGVKLKLSPQTADELLHIVGEAMVNARNHADATTVEVGVNSHGDRVEVTVKDDGCGFDLSAYDSSQQLQNHHGIAMVIVGEAMDGLQAIKRARDLSPDVVLMDIFMPTMNGVEATAILVRNHPWMKVMMLTISDKEEDLYSAIKAGASGYLLKNVRPKELVDAIRQAWLLIPWPKVT